MASRTQADLIIVGMGPVGATAAGLAGAAGLRTVVLDRELQPYALPRAIHFDAEIMRVFASIGLRDALAQATRPLGGSVYLGADLKPIRTFRSPGPAHADAAHPSNLFYQPQLEAILRDNLQRFEQVDVRLGHDVREVVQDDGGCRVTATTADGDTVEIDAAFVLACDGASSPVRKALGIELDDIGFQERWLVVDTFVRGAMRWPDAYAIPPEVRDGRFSLMVCDPSRPATLIPSIGDHRRWEYRLEPDEPDALVTSDAWLRREIGAWVDPDDVEMIRSAVYNFRALIAHRWQEGRIFLAGDAAHQTPPFFGQGMCHGIRDATQLIWKLRLMLDGAASPALLDSYQVEREPHVRAIVAASVAAGAAVCITDAAAACARDAEFRAIEAARATAPVAMTDVVPPIHAGAIDPATGGARFPELVVDDDGQRIALDTLLGGRFALVANRTPGLAAGTAARWQAIGGGIVVL
ncbi:bifunctional 3-(3-hydroxy-phenyl)propionate/3-hydroxycinnamic acid hydroxylase, partial [Sphingomonas bacterium]|uniref:bifunctional 3-(3-hydroxy-phenyl)propionate/3-hydroxycinnamic acid hydroxylase n=1 Tax=Sphingomonas bacterium TaxID=1895847 RepID=UPI001576E6A2